MSDATRTITISGFPFEVSTPFAEGHTCTEAEAKALNQTRSENIRNNMARRVKDAKDEDGNIDEAVMQELADAVAQYDADYEFTLAAVGGSSSAMSPVEKMAMQIAREGVHTQLQAAGRKLSEFRGKEADPELNAKYLELIASTAASDAVVAMAEQRVAEQEAAAVDLGDLV